MAITGLLRWDEGPISVEQADADCELRYILKSDDPGNDDRGSCISWLVDNAPATLFGLYLTSVEVGEQIYDNNNLVIQERAWSGVAKYKTPGKKKPKELKKDEVRLSIRSGTGGSIKQLYSRAMVEEIYADPEYKFSGGTFGAHRLLGLESDNNEDNGAMFVAKGVDIPVGTVELVVELVLAHNTIAAGYLINASDYAARQVINSVDWRGFPAGCVKLLNIDAKQRGAQSGDSNKNPEDWEVTYTMAFQPYVTAAQLNAARPPGLEAKAWTQDKRGWDYLDILYIQTEFPAPNSPAFKFLLPIAKRAAIQKIYEEINFFAVLQI